MGTSKNPFHGIFRGRSLRETRNELTPFQSLTRLGGAPSMGRTGTSKGFSRCPDHPPETLGILADSGRTSPDSLHSNTVA